VHPGIQVSRHPGIRIVYVCFKIQRVLLIVKREKPTKWVVGATLSPPTLSPLSPKEKREKEKIAIFNLVQKGKCHGRPFILHSVNQCVLMTINY